MEKDSSILRDSRIERLSTLHKSSDPRLFTMTLYSWEYCSMDQPINLRNRKEILTT
jgi:hypothetical protein